MVQQTATATATGIGKRPAAAAAATAEATGAKRGTTVMDIPSYLRKFVGPIHRHRYKSKDEAVQAAQQIVLSLASTVFS